MSDKVDLSLDQIIKMSKKNRANNKPNKPNVQRLKNLGARSGIIKKGGPKQVNKTPASNSTTMLHVANLHYNVSNEDVKELFSEIGPIKKAAVHYDKSGRSLGTAEVIFSNREDAIHAIKKYNDVPLDGRQMNITLVPSSNRSSAKSRIGVKPESGIRKRTQQQQAKTVKTGRVIKGRTAPNRGGKPNFQPRNGRQPRRQVTAEELDADLESYNQHNNDQ